MSLKSTGEPGALMDPPRFRPSEAVGPAALRSLDLRIWLLLLAAAAPWMFSLLPTASKSSLEVVMGVGAAKDLLEAKDWELAW